MVSIAQTETRLFSGERHGAHQLPDLREAAEEIAAAPRPDAEVTGIGVELVGTRVERGARRPAGWCLSRNRIHDRDAKRGAADRLTAAGAADRVVLFDQGGDSDPHDLPAAEAVRRHAADCSGAPHGPIGGPSSRRKAGHMIGPDEAPLQTDRYPPRRRRPDCARRTPVCHGRSWSRVRRDRRRYAVPEPVRSRIPAVPLRRAGSRQHRPSPSWRNRRKVDR
jgi:hypothetical protein